MKRVILAGAAVGLLALAAVALASAKPASTKPYTGNASNEHCPEIQSLTCVVLLDGKFENGKVTKVLRFAWRGIPTVCTAAGTTLNSTDYPPAMTVSSNGDFSGHFHLDTQSVDITGGFSKDYKSVGGTLRIHGELPQRGKCDTGTDSYHVVRLTSGQ